MIRKLLKAYKQACKDYAEEAVKREQLEKKIDSLYALNGGLTSRNIILSRLYETANDNYTRLKEKTDWIPTKVRMPAINGRYTVTIQGASESTSLIYDRFTRTWKDGANEIYPVVAWMEKPEAYRA